MKQKIVGIVAACACVFMFVAGGVGFWEIQKEAKDKQAEKEATLEQLDTLKAGVTKLEENRPAYEEGLKAYETGLAQYEAGKAEYEKGKQDLAAGKQEYEAGKKKLAAGKAEYAKGKQDLAAGKAEYAKGQQELAAGKAKYAKGQQDLAAGKAKYAENKKLYDEGMAEYTETFNNKDAKIKEIAGKMVALSVVGYPETDISDILTGKKVLTDEEMVPVKNIIDAIPGDPRLQYVLSTTAIPKATAVVETGLNEAKKQLDENAPLLAEAEAKIAAGEKELAAAEKEIAAGEQKLAAAEKEITAGEKKLAAAEKEIAAGEKKLAAAEKEIAAGEKKLADAEVQLADAEVQLADGKAQLEVFEEGQAQVDAGYATVLKNEKVAAKVDGGMEILDAAYEVVDEETVATTDRLMGRATYLGIAMAAALIVLIGVAVVWFNKRAVVIAAIALVAAIVANVYGLTRTYHEHELQMAAMIVLAVMAAIFTGVCAMKKKEIETA